MAKTITVRISDDVYKTFTERASAEKRSISNFIEMAALQYALESEFADLSEMNDILGDTGLVRRIKQGYHDVKARRGKFVA